MALHVLACQPDIAWEDPATNCRAVAALLEAAAPPNGSLVVLPEMFSTGFSMNVAVTAQGPDRATERFMAETAARLGVCLVGGVVRRDPPAALGLNQAVAFGPDGAELARYSKIHPFSFAGEERHVARGGDVVTFAWEGFTVAPFVCYDLRFPEVFRIAARAGANLLLVIANWPAAREAHWLTLLGARAIENQAYVVGVNRCGRDPNAAYAGRSLVLDPRGRVIAEGGEEEGVVEADLDLEALTAYRREFPALADLDPRFVPDARRRP
jgi:omega-amidase